MAANPNNKPVSAPVRVRLRPPVSNTTSYVLLICGAVLVLSALALLTTSIGVGAKFVVLLPGLVFFYLGLARVYNRNTLTIGEDAITVRPSGLPLPGGATAHAPLAAATRVYIEQHRTEDEGALRYQLMVRYADLHSELLLKDYDDLAELERAERVLEGVLRERR